MKQVLTLKDNVVYINDIAIQKFKKINYDNMNKKIIEKIIEHQENFQPRTIYDELYDLENYDYIFVVIYQLNKMSKKVFGEPLFLTDGRNKFLNPKLKNEKVVSLTINLPVDKYQNFLKEYKAFIVK